MPKEDMLVVDIDREPNVQETKVDGAGKLNALSWLCHHAGQMAKGSVALLGLLVLGGIGGYYFGRRQSTSSSASSVSNALEVAGDFSGALANEATPTPISFIGAAAAANKPLDLVYAESAESDEKKIGFGNEEESHKNTQEQSSVRVEMQNTATTDDKTKELVVNGTIPDQLLEVGHPWSATINMTALFGEKINITGFSQVDNQRLPGWLQAAPQSIGSGMSGFAAYGIVLRDNYAYVATYIGLQIIDITNSSHPFQKSNVTGFDARDVTVQGNLAYVAARCEYSECIESEDGLRIIDISNSSHPVIIEPGVKGFKAWGITVQGNLTYVAALEGLKIIDVSNSSNPFEKSSVPGFQAFGVTVQGNLAYVAAWNNQGLKIIDVSNSSNPFIIEPGVPGFDARGVTVQGNLAYVAAWNNQGLKIIDVSNSSDPVVIEPGVPGFYAYGVTVQGNLAYVATAGGLQIINIGNTTNPVLVGSSTSDVGSCIKVRDNLVYIVGTAGLKIIDLSKWQLSGVPMQSKCNYQFVISSENLLHGNATKTFTIKTDNFPYVVGSIPNQSLYPKNSLFLAVQLTSVFADKDKEDTLFLSINSGPQQDWLSFAIKPIFIARRTNFYSIAYSVTVQGNLAYVAAYSQGLKIIDVSNSSDPYEKSSVPEFYAYGVTVQGNLAYVAADRDQGLKIIDVSNSSDPYEKSSVPGFSAVDVIVQGNLAYVAAWYNQGLKIIDVSNSSAPVEKSSVTGFYAYVFTVQGNLAYVAALYNQGLKIIDVSDSAHPFEKSSVAGFDARGVTVQGNLAYVAALYNQGLKIIDVSNSSNPFIIEPGVPGFDAYDVTIQGNLAYVAARGQGLKIIDVSKPNNPIIVSEFSGATPTASAVLPANKICVVGNVFGILDLANYQFSDAPTEKDVGNYNIQVTATDSFVAYTSTNFTIRVEGGPRLSPNVTIPPRIALVGQPANFFVEQGTFEDPNNDVITYTAKLANGEKLPAFLSFNPSSATFFGIPAKSDKKNYLVTILASDRIVDQPTAENFVLAVQDTIPEQTFIVGRDGEKSLSIPDDTTFEGRSLVYNIKPRSNETWSNWLHFDAPSRKLFGTPSAADVGTTSMQVTLNDSYGETFFLLSLKVKFNSPPVLMSMIPVQNVKAGDSYEFIFEQDTFADEDNDPLRYSADSEKVTSWFKFYPETRKFIGTPSGWTDTYVYSARKYTITIFATDPSNETATATFELTLNGPSYWEKFITAGITIVGTVITAYGYTQKKHLLWDFFKKGNYVRPNKLIALGDTEFSHRLRLPAQKIKSITVTLSQERSCAKGISPCFKKTLGFFPILGDAVNDMQTRVFPCGGVSAYLFPWLFYDSKLNILKTIEGGPTAEFVGKDIKIQIRETDNCIMEEFHIKVENPRRDYRMGLDVAARDDIARTERRTAQSGAKSVFKATRQPDRELKEMKYPPDLAHQPASVMNRT